VASKKDRSIVRKKAMLAVEEEVSSILEQESLHQLLYKIY
jgi:hypothetical protein